MSVPAPGEPYQARHEKALVDLLEAAYDSRQLVEMEIGCGQGAVLTRMAKARPEVLFVGVEVVAERARASSARLANFRNAVVAWADAGSLLNGSVPDGTISGIHLYFPTPDQRKVVEGELPANVSLTGPLVRPQFAVDIARTSLPMGFFRLATDDKRYARMTAQLLLSSEWSPRPWRSILGVGRGDRKVDSPAARRYESRQIELVELERTLDF